MSLSSSYQSALDDLEADYDPSSVEILSGQLEDAFSDCAGGGEGNHLKEAVNSQTGTLYFSASDTLTQEPEDTSLLFHSNKDMSNQDIVGLGGHTFDPVDAVNATDSTEATEEMLPFTLPQEPLKHISLEVGVKRPVSDQDGHMIVDSLLDEGKNAALEIPSDALLAELDFSDKDLKPKDTHENGVSADPSWNGSLCLGHLTKHSWIPLAHKDDVRRDEIKRDGGDNAVEIQMVDLGGKPLQSREIEGRMSIGEYVGRKVRKRFGRELFMGDVIGYDSEQKWYKVVYEDGDEEDLEIAEVEDILLTLDTLHRGPLKSADVKIPQRCSKKMRVSKKQVKKGGISFEDDFIRVDWFLKAPTVHKTSRLVPLKNAVHGNSSKNKQNRCRRSGTGITLQEGINRYLRKLGNTEENFMYGEVKQQSLAESKTSCERTGAVDTASKGMKIISNQFDIFEEFDDVAKDSFRNEKFKAKMTGGRYLKQVKRGVASTKDARKNQAEDLGAVDGANKRMKAVMGENTCPLKSVGKADQSGPEGMKHGEELYKGSVSSSDQARNVFNETYEDVAEEELKLTKLEPALVVEGEKGMKVKSTSRESCGKYAHDVCAWTGLIGRPIRKEFGGIFYNGTVISYDKKEKFFKVKYEDGDQEDLEWEELKPLLGTTEDGPECARSNGKSSSIFKAPKDTEPGW